MNENEWTETIKELLQSSELGEGIEVSTLTKLPYTMEVTSFTLDFEPETRSSLPFETDLLIYEKSAEVIVPRVVIEAKFGSITTHDAITYSYKAQSHKSIIPFLRYGIMIGNRGHYPLPGRLFRHGSNFDFMISFCGEKANDSEKKSFVELVKKEILYSKQLEEIILNPAFPEFITMQGVPNRDIATT